MRKKVLSAAPSAATWKECKEGGGLQPHGV